MSSAIDDDALAALFTEARTHYSWSDRKIDNATLHHLYEIARWPPTSTNSNPARFVFIVSDAGRERIKPALFDTNIDKTMSAPLTVIVAMKMDFYLDLPRLFPAKPDVAEMYGSSPQFAEETAFRNSTLQGAYLLLAARALGLDCGPMSGFDRQMVDEAFFGDSGYKSNFLINIGYAGESSVRPRGPRLTFEEAVEVV